MARILFVCTGNIFRSMSAEYILKDFLRKKGIKNIEVSSAGTRAHLEQVNPEIPKVLDKWNINISNHKQRKLTKKIIDENDLIIAMATYHQEFIKKNFDLDVPLFNEVAGLGKTSVLDIDDVIEDYRNNKPEVRKHLKKIIEHIHEHIPEFYKNLNKWLK